MSTLMTILVALLVVGLVGALVFIWAILSAFSKGWK